MKAIKKCALLCILVIFIFPTIVVNGAEYPNHTDNFYVNDFAGVIDFQTEEFIMSTAVSLAQRTEAQVVVVTINSLEDNTIEDYAYSIFKSWGIGGKEGNNGVLVLVAVDDRRSRIEVGYGLEGALPDGKTGRIQDDYMLPYFRENDYATGIKSAFQVIVNEVYEEYGIEGNIEAIPAPGGESDNTSSLGDKITKILIALFFLFDWIFLRGRITKMLLTMFFLGGRGGRGGGRGGFGGGGGFGDGGFSGGGGRSGGGGSSRSW